MEQLHAYDCHQNVTEPQATKKYTRARRNCESGLAIIYKACCIQAAGPAHATGYGDGMDR